MSDAGERSFTLAARCGALLHCDRPMGVLADWVRSRSGAG